MFECRFYSSLFLWHLWRFRVHNSCSHAAISLWFLQFFRFFGSDFFLNGFPNPFRVRSWSSFLFSQWKFFELYARTCPAMFFISSSQFLLRPWRHNHFKSAFCSFVHAILTEVRVWRHFSLSIVRVFFCSFVWIIFRSHLTYLTLRIDFSNLTFIYFNSWRWGQVGVSL